MTIFLRIITGFYFVIYVCSCNEDSSSKTVEVKKEDSTAYLFSHDTINKPYVAGNKLTYEQAYDKALTLFQVPFIEKKINTKFGKAHVIVCGPQLGEPIVLLHGMNASSTMWYPNIAALAKTHRVYAIDCFLEPGKSEYLGTFYGIKEVVDWYFDVFDGLNLKKFTLVGASRGGWLSVNIASKAPERINKLILLSPAQTFGVLKPSLEIFTDINYFVNPKREKLRDFLETMSSNVDTMDQIFINQFYLATLKAAIDPDLLKMQPFSVWQLRKLKMPMLVLIGDNDIFNGPLNLHRAEQLCPNAQTAIIPAAGHFLSMDQPFAVNERMLKFLRSPKH